MRYCVDDGTDQNPIFKTAKIPSEEYAFRQLHTGSSSRPTSIKVCGLPTSAEALSGLSFVGNDHLFTLCTVLNIRCGVLLCVCSTAEGYCFRSCCYLPEHLDSLMSTLGP